MPRLEIAQARAYNSGNQSPSDCISNVMIDEAGRCWVATCGVNEQQYQLRLMQFDGFEFLPVSLANEQLRGTYSAHYQGFDEEGQIIGFLNSRTDTSYFFRFDPETKKTQLIPLIGEDSSVAVGLSLLQLEKGVKLLFLESEEELLFYRLQGRQLKIRFRLPRPESSSILWLASPFVGLTEYRDDFWVSYPNLPVMRFSSSGDLVASYDLRELPERIPGWDEKDFAGLTVVQDQLFLFVPESSTGFFTYDAENDRFEALDLFPAAWKRKGLRRDESGNLVFLFDTPGGGKSWLRDTSGMWYDFSAILQGQSFSNRLIGKDFRKEVMVCSPTNGLTVISVKSPLNTQTFLQGKSIRWILEAGEGKLLISTFKSGYFVMDPETYQISPLPRVSCDPNPFEGGHTLKLMNDRHGYIWKIWRNSFVRYDPVGDECRYFPFDEFPIHFNFVGADTIAFMARESHHLFFFNKKTGTLSTYRENGREKTFSRAIQEIHVSDNGIIWLVTTNGLWEVDLRHAKSRQIGFSEDFQDFRFLSIYEDDRGLIWLGTVKGGLHRFNPTTGEVQVLQEDQGLTNNTVVSIQPDDSGLLWVGTYNGISVVDPILNLVLFNVTPSEGLSEPEFNRYSSFRTSDGKLLFGTINGLNLIDPALLKENIAQLPPPKVYLTYLEYYDKQKGGNIPLTADFDRSFPLTLPAQKRYLKLSVAQSSYYNPEKNRFAYRLKGMEEEWNYVGFQRELVLTNLPAGHYNLQIKGANSRGIWSEEVLEIPLLVKEHFYKQAWFYLVLVLFLGALALGWIWQLSGEKRRLEKEVRYRTKELRSDKELIEQQAKELRQLDDLKSRFFSDISHELRTPITLITTPIEQLLGQYSKQEPPAWKRSMLLVRQNARKLLNLVEELLELSRIEAGKIQLSESEVSFYPYCRQLFSAYASQANSKKIDYRIIYELSPDLNLRIDKRRLEKIVNNLLSNALKYTPEAGRVQMRISQEDSNIVVEVEDTGIGISKEDLPFIFDRYYQSEHITALHVGGTGIGLSLAKELALLMKGELSVKSEAGKGSIFMLRFPAPKGTSTTSREAEVIIEKRSPQPAQKKSPEDKPAPVGQKSSILIVEDNRDMQNLLHSLLEDRFNCFFAGNGQEGIDWLQAEGRSIQDLELIITDVMMPVLDGFDFLKWLKEQETWRMLPVIMLTARAGEESRIEALRIGVDDYITKPFSPGELTARINNLIRNYRIKGSYRQELHEKGLLSKLEETPSHQETWLKQAETIILDALEKKIQVNVGYLASNLSISERQLHRKLKSITGLTPNQYILEVKLQMARHVLEQKSFSTVAEVAYASGFNTPNYFARVFRKHFGKNPGEYLS